MRALLAILPFALLIGACNAQGTVELQIKSTSTTDPPAIVRPPTPGPVPEINPQLRAVVKRVDIYVDSSQMEATAQEMTNGKSGGWTTIFTGEQQVNLFDTSDVAKTIGSALAPVGTVTQVRLYLDKDVDFIDSTGNYPVACPSCTDSGLNLSATSDIEVQQNNTLHLTLNIDGKASLTETVYGFLLKPVVQIEGYNDELPNK